jgi:feruloyl esterase
MKTLSLVCAVAAFICLPATTAFAASCESLATLALKDTTITRAEVVAAGTFQLPDGPGRGPNPYRSLAPFCRVAATLTPTTDSDIKIEIWLPTARAEGAPGTTAWNGKFQAVGNGGWAGVISYSAMAEALQGGYATASTDTGHVGGRGTFALGHPEKLVDFAWRSEHEMTATAKKVIAAFYGSAPRLSYWNGCSTGGRQGLKAAQMFPEDYDGIIAGAPANRTAISLWIADAVLRDPGRYIPPAKYPLIHQAALAACDAGDGVKDGLIDDPRRCRFDPAVLLCKQGSSTAQGAGDDATCLTAPQVAAARQIYADAVNPRTKKALFASLVPGSELGWGAQAAGPEPSPMIYDQYRYVVFKDPKWDWKTFDFDKDVVKGDLPENLIMNATNPDMRPFFSRGGKLILYHGWSDPLIPPANTIKYYEQVVAHMGGAAKTTGHVRLFMAPGMGHCSGGEGPDTFDKVKALEDWVERGKAPARLDASHSSSGRVDRTRPLCPYPQVARYSGTGSIDDAANFTCKAP